MRVLLRLVGSLLVLTSLFGLVGVAVAPALPESIQPESMFGLIGGGTRPRAQMPDAQTSKPLPAGFRAITRLVIPRIALAADVVPAKLIERDGGETWEVPAFKAGHAESTAGAGQPGNAVLLGHVTSVHSGNVFESLHEAEVGDSVQIFSDDDEFDYRVVAVSAVPRTDSDVLVQGSTPTVSLITCTGVWLPSIWDYTERLVVRAELVGRS